MKRFQCMQALGARLKDELVILSLGASVDEWYNAAPHMRAASLFQQQLGCVTPEAFGLAVGLPHRRIVSLDTDGGMMFNLGILATLANEQPSICSSLSGTISVICRSAARRRIPPGASTLPLSRVVLVSNTPTRRPALRNSMRTALKALRRRRLMLLSPKSSPRQSRASSASTAMAARTNTFSFGTSRRAKAL